MNLNSEQRTQDVVIITNSPGELSSWVKVTIEKLKIKGNNLRIIVMLVPCPYASGKEAEIAKSIPGVNIVVPPKDFIDFLFTGRISYYKPSLYGVVVFLGGDFWHALLVAKKLQFLSVAYTVRASKWNKYFRFLGVRDEKIKEKLNKWGMDSSSVKVVGNLMVDQVNLSMSKEEAIEKWGLDKDSIKVGILPGSRLCHVEVSLPYYLKVAEDLAEQFPKIEFLLGVSPFLTLEEVETCLAGSDTGVEYTTGKIMKENENLFIETKKGTRIRLLQHQQYDMINICDLVLTIPGTNTAEIAALHKPMIVSSTWRAKVPRGGLTGGFLRSLPLGSFLRKKILFGILKRIKFTALPNQIAQREVVPEVIVESKSSEVTNIAADLLRNEALRDKMKKELEEIIAKSSASDNMADLITETLKLAPLPFADSPKIRTSFREWIFGWRGWIIAPFAIVILLIAKPTLLFFLIGLVMALLGEFMRIWAVGFAGSTTRESELVAPQLVTAGPYAYIKNPLYAGNIITGFGFCIMAIGGCTIQNTLIIFLLFLVIYSIVYGLIIPLEEVYLYETFGECYLKYSRTVPRILPFREKYSDIQGKFNWQVIFKAEIHTLIILAIMVVLMFLKLSKIWV